MKKIISFLLFVHGWFLLNAQMPTKNALDSIQYQVIEATVNFLATDTFFGRNKPRCIECVVNRYDILKSYAKRNNIQGSVELINEWKLIRIDTAEAQWQKSMLEFKSIVHNKIATGDKSRRQALPEYQKYKNYLDSIVNDFIHNFEPQTVPESNILNNFPLENTGIKAKATYSLWQKQSSFQYLLYGIIILLAIGLIFFIRLAKKENKSKNSYKGADNEKSQILEHNAIETEALRKSNMHLQEKIVLLEEELKAERKKQSIHNKVSISPQEQTKTQETFLNTSSTKYALYADQGDGFTANDLLPESNSETIFEIKITSPNTASYKIATNASAQKYALSDAAYFLGKTCKYESAPSGQSNIHTDQPGELKLQGNKWAIISPAIISFR